VSEERSSSQIPRRDFIKSSVATTAAAMAAGLLGNAFVDAQGNERLRVGLVGCGGRGSGAIRDCLDSAPGIEVYALGDLFEDRWRGLRDRLANEAAERVNLTDERCFTGFDAYRKVIDSGVDIVIFASPPGFRPVHFRAAVEAGRHVFMEKPVAVCPAGVRMVLAAGKVAEEKKLGVVAGTQRRHQRCYVETIKRLREGAIGKVVAAQCYWNQGGLWKVDREPGWSDVEWQIRNWLYFTWLSGDHIVEQHIHNIDVCNWIIGTHPVKCLGLGGRQVRTDPSYGQIYDHFAVEYEYPDGVRMMSMARQIDGCANRVGENVLGSEGWANPSGYIQGKEKYQHDGRNDPNPYVQEHTDLIASIRAGTPLNETQSVAETTLTAIMGRMSTYTGQEVSWDQARNSKLDLVVENPQFGDRPVDEVAMPGRTPLI
jgi:predicted dehydrogenase